MNNSIDNSFNNINNSIDNINTNLNDMRTNLNIMVFMLVNDNIYLKNIKNNVPKKY